MATTLRIKRRASGNAGAPASLQNAELAFNEVDDTLYYGKGTGGAGGTATTVEAIGGKGAFVSVAGSQTVTGDKTFSGTVNMSGATAVQAPTRALADSSTHVATTAFVKGQGYGPGTVTSVGLSLPAELSVTGSPVTASGTLSAAWAAASANRVLATPDGISGTPAFRALVAADIPSLTAAKISNFDTAVNGRKLSDFTGGNSGDISLAGYRLTNVSDPTSAQDAATKAYVDAVKTGLDIKDSVRAATTANITLSGTQTIDGVALVAGDRVLVKNQTTASANGIYVVATGAWARATDADNTPGSEVHGGMFCFVTEGAANADSGWVLTTNDPVTLGTTNLAFTQFSGAGQIADGDGIAKSGNTISVAVGTGLAVSKAGGVALTGQALSLHNLSTNGIFVRASGSSVVARSVAASGTGITVANGDGVSGNPTVALSDALSSVGSLTPVADRIAYYTGAAAAALATLSAFGRSLIDDADAAAARTTLGLGSLATQAAASVAITGGTIDNVTLDGGTF